MSEQVRNELMYKKWKRGESQADIAREYGLTRVRVSQIVRNIEGKKRLQTKLKRLPADSVYHLQTKTRNVLLDAGISSLKQLDGKDGRNVLVLKGLGKIMFLDIVDRAQKLGINII